MLHEKNEAISRQNVEISMQKEEIQEQAYELEATNHEISAQKQRVEQQNEQITSSIQYGQNIQEAMLPTIDDLNEVFENFILFLPKDIVSGDFYWMSKIKADTQTGTSEQMFIAAIDCTGHGVPGAFMSMIGNRLLNEIVNERGVYDPKEILEQLNVGVRTSLKQEQTDNNDGMDVCLCRIEQLHSESPENDSNKEKTKITFSGAKRPLFYFRQSETDIVTVKGDLRSIGRTSAKKRRPFTNKEVILNKGDVIYLTTDGIIDQHAPNRKRFGTGMLTDLLQTIAVLQMSQQKEVLEEALAVYMQNEEQRDDITIMGIRV